MNGETKKVDQKKFFKRFVLCQGTLKLIKNSFRRKNRSILTCGQVNSGLPKAEGLRPKSKVSQLRLQLWLSKVYAVEGRRSGQRLKFFENK